MNVKELLITELQKFSDNVFLQGTFNPNDDYPASFITFWTDYTFDISHYNNDVHSVAWNFSVIFYSSNPKELLKIPFEIIADLKQVGFIPQGKGNDIPSDEPTHTGWAMEFIYKENI